MSRGKLILRLLIVDDESSTADTLAIILRQNGLFFEDRTSRGRGQI